MTNADFDCIVAEKQMWRCHPCSKLRRAIRKSMETVSAAESGTAIPSQVVSTLREASEGGKRMEKEFNS